MGTPFEGGPTGYILCRREACGKYVGFVGTSGNCIVVTDNPYDEARRYLSEYGAKTALHELNTRPYSTGNWEIVKLYI